MKQGQLPGDIAGEISKLPKKPRPRNGYARGYLRTLEAQCPGHLPALHGLVRRQPGQPSDPLPPQQNAAKNHQLCMGGMARLLAGTARTTPKGELPLVAWSLQFSGICRTAEPRRRREPCRCAGAAGLVRLKQVLGAGAYLTGGPGIASGGPAEPRRGNCPFPRTFCRALEAGMFFDLISRALERGRKAEATPGDSTGH